MLIVSGTIEIDPASVEQAKVAAMEMARETRKEDGCYTYGFWQDLEKDSRFMVYEEWRDRDALKAHAETAHMAVFRAALAEVGVLSRDIIAYERGETTKL